MRDKDTLLLYLRSRLEQGYTKTEIVNDLKVDLNKFNNDCRKFGIKFKEVRNLVVGLKNPRKKKMVPVQKIDVKPDDPTDITINIEKPESYGELTEDLIVKNIILTLNDPTLENSDRLRCLDLAVKLLDKKKAISITQQLRPRPSEEDSNVFID